MKTDQLIELLGKTYNDEKVKSFLTACGITKKPRIGRNDLYASLEAKKAGIEITFMEEEQLGPKFKGYMEGDLVVVNIELQSGRDTDYKRFAGELPHGLSFDFGLKETVAKLGKPAWRSKYVANVRWDFKNYCLLVEFDRDFKVSRTFALLLPGVF